MVRCGEVRYGEFDCIFIFITTVVIALEKLRGYICDTDDMASF